MAWLHRCRRRAGAEVSAVISDRDLWQAALLPIKRYGDDAILGAAARADELTEEGDWQSANEWHRIFDCIERIRAQRPGDGEAVH